MATKYEYETKYGLVRITNVLSDEKEIIVPSILDGKNVYQICKQSFYCLPSESIILPNSIGKIEDNAFDELKNLKYFRCGHIDEINKPFHLSINTREIDIFTDSFKVAKIFKDREEELFYLFKSINYENAFRWKVLDEENKTCKITSFTDFNSEIIFPDEIDGYKVVDIEGKINREVKKVKLPKHLKRIPKRFLMNQLGKVKVIFPEDLEVIEDKAFKNTLLETFVMPPKVNCIQTEAFYIGCYESIDGTIIFKHKDNFEINVFSFAFSHRNLSFDKKTIINPSQNSFEYSIIDRFYINTVLISPSCFAHAQIGRIYGFEKVEIIGAEAFRGAKFIKTKFINLKNVTNCGKAVFYYSNIEKVYIGKKLLLSSFMFAYSNLKEVVFERGYSKEAISFRCFYKTFDIEKMHLPKIIKSIQMEAFAYSNIYEINLENVEEIYTNAFYSSNVSYISFRKLRKIEMGAFSSCSNLFYVYFNKSKVEDIGKLAFYSCRDLVEVGVSPYTLNILDKAFMDCRNLKAFDFKNIQSIGMEAFSSTAVENIKFLKLRKLGIGAFYNCINLVKVHFNKNFYSIPNECFLFCGRLIDINLQNIIEFGDYCLCSCSLSDEIILNEHTCYIGNESFGNTNIKKLILSGKVIKEKAFLSTVFLKNVYIKNVEEIPSGLFKDNSSIEEIIIDKTCRKINYGAFKNLEKLYRVYIENPDCEILGGNFINCPKLTSIYFDNEKEFKKIKKRENNIKNRLDTKDFVF